MNKIKTTKTIILAALVVVGSLFTSCSSDDENQDAPIIGVWKQVSGQTETFENNVSIGVDPHTVDAEKYEQYTFNADNTFIYFEAYPNEPFTDNGTYTASGNNLSLTYDPEDIEDYEFSISDNELILSYTEDNTARNTKYVTTTIFAKQ